MAGRTTATAHGASEGWGPISTLLAVPERDLDWLRDSTAADLERLHRVIARALTAEDEAFSRALEETIRVVPRPLRSIAKRILFGPGLGTGRHD